MGDVVDGELAVEEVVVVLGDEEKSDCEDNLSTSSRNRAASKRVPSMFVAMSQGRSLLLCASLTKPWTLFSASCICELILRRNLD